MCRPLNGIPFMNTDAELMLEVKGGDKAAFEELVRRHHRGLVNFFYRLAYDTQLAEDFAQETFMRVYLHADDYRESALFTSYLYRIARNLWIDEIRKRTSRPRLTPQGTLSAERTDNGESVIPQPADSEENRPDESLLEKERAGILHAAIEKLDEDHRITLVLSMIKEIKYSEISAILDIPVGTVKSRVHNALNMLRDIFKGKNILE